MKAINLFKHLICLWIVSSATLLGQVNYIITAPSNSLANATTGLRAPNGNASHTSMRACYFVPASELSTLTNTINSFGFVLTNTLANAPAFGTLTVYMMNTSSNSYTLGTSWSTATVGMTQVYNGTYTIPSGTTATTVDFPFPSDFAYNPGDGLFLAYEYTGASFASNVVIYSAYSNSAVVCGATNNSLTLPAANTLSTTTFRPLFRFGTPNTYTNEVVVQSLNAYGKDAQIAGGTQTITATIFNGSNNTLNGIPVDLTISGSNPFSNTITISSLAAGVSTVITFPVYTPTVLGPSNMQLSVPVDEDNSNNTISFTHSLTCNVMGTGPASFAPTSYSSGVGFNTGSGIIYSEFKVPATQTLIGINLGISSGINNLGNSVYGVIANASGSILATTSTLTIGSGELNTFQFFNLSSPLQFNANTLYYVGLAQTIGSIGYFPLGNTPAANTPTIYVTQALTGGALTPLTQNFGYFAIEPVLDAPCASVGIEKNVLESDFSVYPNPANSKFLIHAEKEIFWVSISDLNGKEIVKYEEQEEYKLMNISSGVYIIKILFADQTSSNRKLIIK
ncbi:MAG: T9SS type A sorting domain-containing protein [Bacteroidia bacterium]